MKMVPGWSGAIRQFTVLRPLYSPADMPSNPDTPPPLSAELSRGAADLEAYGYCVLPDRMPADFCDTMAARCLELHRDPRHQRNKDQPGIYSGDGYETLFGMLNYDDRFWRFAFHADVLSIARHFLGPNF